MHAERLPTRQQVNELASEALESWRKPDPYIFLIGPEGVLLYEDNWLPIKEQVQRGAPLYEREYKIIEGLEVWARSQKEGSAFVWISPAYPGTYPVSKIIISQKEESQGIRWLENRAIVLDYPTQEALALANRLAPYSENPQCFFNPEDLRQTPIFLKPRAHWTYIMERLFPDTDIWQEIREGKDVKEKTKLAAEFRRLLEENGEAKTRQIARERGLMGSASISCPTSAFEMFFESSQLLFFQCPRCNVRIPSGRGITTCPHCGARKEDYKNCV